MSAPPTSRDDVGGSSVFVTSASANLSRVRQHAEERGTIVAHERPTRRVGLMYYRTSVIDPPNVSVER